MSSPLAIGAVSAVLRNLLDDGLIDAAAPLGSVKVSAVAPDTIKLDDPHSDPSINLFLFRVTPNQGWRNMGLPAFDSGGARTSSPPLALDLHYLMTAYGRTDFQAEILLGYAMHLLHERPVLDRAAIRQALDPGPVGPSILPPGFQALVASDLADQIDAITVTQEPMNTEEMSRLWSSIQTHYRPSAGYVVSVVLIEARKRAGKPLPVLSRGPLDASGKERGVVVEPSLLPPFPTIQHVVPPAGQPAARLGETVRVAGHNLEGASMVARFAHRLLDEPNEIALGASTDATGIDVTLPNGAAAEHAWPAGLYIVTLSLVPPGEPAARESTVGTLLLAPEPELPLPPGSMTRDPSTQDVSITLPVRPQVRPSQDARLSVGTASAPSGPRTTPTSTLDFDLGPIPPGHQWLRLVVDGVESLLVDRSTDPPTFDPSQSVTVPA